MYSICIPIYGYVLPFWTLCEIQNKYSVQFHIHKFSTWIWSCFICSSLSFQTEWKLKIFFYLKIREEKKEESKMRCSIKFSAITQYKHLSPNKDVGSLIGLWQSCLFYFVQTIKLIECFLLKENWDAQKLKTIKATSCILSTYWYQDIFCYF